MTLNYVGIVLALTFQEDYSTEQHHCGENYYGDKISAWLWQECLQHCSKKMDLQQLQNQCKYELNTTFDQICLFFCPEANFIVEYYLHAKQRW